MLDHLRVLDLTDERGLLCGRLLADLGADVVQVEPLTGSTARSVAPLAGGDVSLFWETFAAGKRGVALDLDTDEGVERLRRLASAADVVITSWPRRWLEERGLDPQALRRVNPDLVYTVISAFGWSGPKADYADADLVVWAAGGPLEPHRDGDRPPLRISVPQAFLHASADAAAGALIAVLARRRTGRGQVVDVSAQVSVGVATLSRNLADAVGDSNPAWHQEPARRVDQSGSGAATPNHLKKWRCADGMVELHLSMGPAAGAFTNRLFGWLASEGAVDERIAAWDWRELPERLASGELTIDDLNEARAAVREFLRPKTKAEILDATMKHRLLCTPIFDMADVASAEHFAARDFWRSVDIDGVPTRIPGAFAKVRGARSPEVRSAAPRLGQHTAAVEAEWGKTPRRATPTTPEGTSGAALAGLKVLDLSWVVAGPLIGRALADFGAEVVRVESSRQLDTARLIKPFHGGVQDREGSAVFGNCNAGKLGLTLDLKTEEGRAVVRDLARWADVVIESFSPGQLARWGLDYDALSAINPSVVMLSTSLAGQDGPWSKLAGYGNVGSSLAGFQSLVGWEDALPMGPFGPYTDYVGPRLGLVALLAALENRATTGKGCYIDLSQIEAGVFFLSPHVARYGYDGTVARRRGNRDEQYAPHGVFPCRAEGGRDTFVAIVARSDEEWRRLATTIGRADLAARDDLATAAGRHARADEIEQAIAAWTSTRRAAEVERVLQEVGVPAHVAASSADILTDPQLAHRGYIVTLSHPIHGTTYVEGPRYLLSETPGRPVRAAPTLGRDNDYVLRHILGYDEQRIADLARKGVLQ